MIHSLENGPIGELTHQKELILRCA